MATKQELALLKEQATKLGIAYSPNIGYDTLKKKIDAKLAETEGLTPEDAEPVTKVATTGSKKMNMLKLIRVQITNLDPNDSNLTGEYRTFCNGVTGKIGRMIRYGKPWHIESCMLDSMKEAKFAIVTQEGNKPPRTTLTPKYSIEMLPPLTPEDLADLAKAQQAGNRIDN